MINKEEVLAQMGFAMYTNRARDHIDQPRGQPQNRVVIAAREKGRTAEMVLPKEVDGDAMHEKQAGMDDHAVRSGSTVIGVLVTLCPGGTGTRSARGFFWHGARQS
ncbi:MAG: hypothetical protein U9R25_20180 [Chloroflexota bacterium]|nr:hypothetical protein [Chloroflexota bacterium]